MEPIVHYLEDTEKKLVKEMSELFNTMREQMNTLSLQGIKDMYSLKPVEGVLYDPCVRIPGQGGYYCSEYKLPKDEYVICVRTSSYQHKSGQFYNGTTHKCIVLTNYGRCFVTKQISGDNARGYIDYTVRNDNSIHLYNQGVSSDITPIINLDPLPYKMPEQFSQAFNLGISIASIHETSLHMDYRNGVHECVIKTLSDTMASLQELNKEFYFAQKSKAQLTDNVTLEIDTMRKTNIENTSLIHDLTEKNKALEEQNTLLQTKLKELEEQKAVLEKENAALLPLKKYKETIIECMKETYSMYAMRT